MSSKRVPYTQNDLKGLKKDAVAELIQAQAERWPGHLKKLNTATTKALMSSVLLNPEYGFTKSIPVSPSEGLTSLPDTPSHRSSLSLSHSTPPSHTRDHSDSGDRVVHDSFFEELQHDDDVRDSRPAITDTTHIPTPSEPHVGIIPDQAHEPLAANGEPAESDFPGEVPLYLLIDDQRFNPVRQAAVAMTAMPFRQRGDLYIPSQAVVSAIQSSGQIESGIVKLSCPFRLNSSYDEPFAINVDAKSEYTILRHQDQLFVPDGYNLNVRINHNVQKLFPATTSVNLNQEADNLGHIDQAMTSPSVSATGANHLRAPSPPAHPRRTDASKRTVEWLKDKLRQRNNYTLFSESTGRTLQNPTVIQVWKFVGDFYAVYFNAKSAVSGGLVTKKAIADAMDVGETWLTETLAGDRLARIYGRNGPHMDKEVVDELDASRDPPRGRKVLLEFLQRWEKEHPCVD